MKVAICDDQKEYNAELKKLLKTYFRAKQIANYEIKEYTSGVDLSKEHAPNMFTFVFLDIQMPDLSGFETADKIRKTDLTVDIVFVTNMSDQIHMGYNYNAKGYLIKPVTQEQIDTLLDRLLSELRRREDIGTYLISLKFDKGNVLLHLTEVQYFESKDKYITAVTKEDRFEFRKKLSELEEELKEKGFIRINRSLLVNTAHIFKDFGDSLKVKGVNELLPIGREYKESVRKALSMKG